jgi:hypothetical protein
MGDPEQDTRSVIFNRIEGIIVYILVIATMWLIIWPFALNPSGPRLEWVEQIGYAILGILALWALIISPLLHKDTFAGIGLGHPKKFLTFFRHRVRERGILLGLLPIFILFLIMLLAWIVNKNDISESLGISGFIYWIITLPLVGLATFVVSAIMIRWDVFLTKECWKMIFFGMLIVGSFLIVTALLYCIAGIQEWSVFTEFKWFGAEGFLNGWFGYIWWGFLQHYLFLGYFNTRLRKGFENRKYWGISGRWWSAGLNMFYFGIIHIPAWELAIFAFTGGLFFAWVFQQEKYRSLFAMGFIHGFGGALLGLLPWTMSVGPWA